VHPPISSIATHPDWPGSWSSLPSGRRESTAMNSSNA
jgi:hypothetical protein